MDTKALIKKLRNVFLKSSNSGKRYSQIWLSEINFDGLYYSNKFALNLKTEYPIERYFTEIEYIITLLSKEAKEELKSIMHVLVYSPNEYAEPESEDYLVYEAETAMP